MKMNLNGNLGTTLILGFLFSNQNTSSAAFQIHHRNIRNIRNNTPTSQKYDTNTKHKMRPPLPQRPYLRASLRASTDTIVTSNIREKESFPQWRTLPTESDDDDATTAEQQQTLSASTSTSVSYFAHASEESASTSSDNPNVDADASTTTFQNAIWSNSAYISALKQYDAFVSCTDSYIAPYIQDALHTLDHAYRLYGPESVVGSFNGGKDAVVILELIRAAHANYYRSLLKEQREKGVEGGTGSGGGSDGDGDGATEIIRPRTIYFNNQLEFPQVLQFVRDTVHNYDLDMIAFQEGIGFVGGLEMLVRQNYLHPTSTTVSPTINTNTRPHAMAFVLGTRAADPNAGKQGTFAPSSSWMPPFMRVNPILEWSYGHIWHFLRLYKLPYCSLYDEGYTSLGTVSDTLPCPALKKVNVRSSSSGDGGDGLPSTPETDEGGDSKAEYWPAYMLKDWDMERAGRIKKDKKKKSKEPKEEKEKKQVAEVDDTISRCSTVASLPKDSASMHNNNNNNGVAKVKGDVPQNVDIDDESLAGSRGSIQRTVGIIIIGDEILKGMTPDTNTHAAASVLNANGVPLARVAVVSDNQEEIVAEIEQMNDLVDVIITSGGVGPTHDDVTIKSVADALGSDMIFNEEMAELLKSKMNKSGDGQDGKGDDLEHGGLTEAQVKMATLPGCSRLKYLSGIEGDWPVLQCGNIFILPGVPQFFEKKVEHVASYLSTELERSVAFKVVLSIDENSIVPILNNVVQNHPNVSFGSYPFVDHPEAKTVVTVEGKVLGSGSEGSEQFNPKEIDVHVKVALSDLVNKLPDGNVLRVDNNNDLTFL